MPNQPEHVSAGSGPSKVTKALFSPLPDRWRPFSVFLGGALILAVLTIFGRYGTDAWRFFAVFTVMGAVVGVIASLSRANRRAAKTSS